MTKEERWLKPTAVSLPAVRVGETVVVHQKISEGGRERVQAFEGLVIKVKKPRSPDGSFTVRKESFGIGVEKNYPLLAPTLTKIEFKKQARVRKARLFFLRRSRGRARRLRESALKRPAWKPSNPQAAQP